MVTLSAATAARICSRNAVGRTKPNQLSKANLVEQDGGDNRKPAAQEKEEVPLLPVVIVLLLFFFANPWLKRRRARKKESKKEVVSPTGRDFLHRRPVLFSFFLEQPRDK